MKKILIIQTAFIGDVILATPVVSEIKRIFPDCQIDFLLRKGNESLLANNPCINEVFILDKKKGKYLEFKRLIQLFRSNQYDEILNLHRYLSSGIFTLLGGAKTTTGFKTNPLSFFFTHKIDHSLTQGKHEVERNLSAIKRFGASSLVRPNLYPSDVDFQYVNSFKVGDYFCMAPSSVWFTKMLPVEKWIELIDLIKERGKIYLLGGPGDFDLCQNILQQSNATNIENLAGKLSFLQSAALIKSAKRNFVNDSGPLHICSAMNAKVTVFFCSTITDFGFGPLSDDSKVMEVQKLACRPCGVHGHKECPKGDFRCGNDINIEIEFNNSN